MEADILLKITTKLVTGQVICKVEVLTRNDLVGLLSDGIWQQRLQALYNKNDLKII